MKKQRGHYKLNAALIEKAGRLASLGWSQKAIAQACGVTEEMFCKWLSSAKGDDPTRLELQLFQAIHEASSIGEERLAAKIADGDTRDAQWLLTHSARWRDNWSDAAATRREINTTLNTIVQIIQQSDLTPEQQDHLLLRMQAAGLGAAA
jgi:transcriptional regulator with XRE-family HTH domain